MDWALLKPVILAKPQPLRSRKKNLCNVMWLLRNNLPIDIGASLAPEKNKVCFKNDSLKAIFLKFSAIDG